MVNKEYLMLFFIGYTGHWAFCMSQLLDGNPYSSTSTDPPLPSARRRINKERPDLGANAV